jgi:mannitol/fructose-specific phosphotransferase system IIA component (Ntr-type)
METIKPAFIELDLTLNNKEEVLSRLVDSLASEGCLSDKAVFLEAVLEREKLMSTYCGFNIAIPHAVSKAVLKPAFGFCKTSHLEWDAEDEPVEFILLLAIPEQKNQKNSRHIDLMSHIATLALEEEVRGVWKNAVTQEEIINTFC